MTGTVVGTIRSPGRRWRVLQALAMLTVLSFLAALLAARADPVMRHARIGMRGWPAGVPPVRVALLSDIHLGSASTDLARLTRTIRAITAARPDLILVAGDYIDAEKAGVIPELLAPMRELRAPLGVVAVLGNHDWSTSPTAIVAVLEQAGVTVLENSAVARGPLAIGVVGDSSTSHADTAATLAMLRRTPGVPLILTHSPDPAATLPPGLVLAGHTHCGQVVLPLIGPLETQSKYGARFACGLIREGHRLVVVSAGIGTSEWPIRVGAPPDWWLLTLGPLSAARPAGRTTAPAPPRTPPRR